MRSRSFRSPDNWRGRPWKVPLPMEPWTQILHRFPSATMPPAKVRRSSSSVPTLKTSFAGFVSGIRKFTAMRFPWCLDRVSVTDEVTSL